MVIEGEGGGEIRSSRRSHGLWRHTMYTDEVNAIYCGITSGAIFFKHHEATHTQMLGMCTMLHHILFQELVRPHVGPLTNHGLGTLVSQRIDSPADRSEREVLMVGLIQPSSIHT